ncbi:UNVERIFIED_CONTAM: hypothetical protein PYX00_005370 [Menopon gallinae]|uniref:MARVEL domain-containing protein n=1 Tax=Menopon gallinae TaxID=328185 RepID=A0AAW2HR64_9NEOP
MAQIVGNLDFVKKVPGILKLCELGLGIICLALSANYSVNYNPYLLPFANFHVASRSECFFLVTSIMFFTTTLLIIVSSLLSDTTETRLRQSLFEPLYHGLAFILYFSGSVALLADDW